VNPRPLGRLLTVAMLCMAAVAGVGRPTAAQTTAELLAQRRLEYKEAKDAYEYARSALRVVEQRFSTALNEVSRAKLRGDDGALAVARALVQEQAIPYGAQEERVKEQRARVAAARKALIEIVTIRQEQLLDQLDAASSGQERAQLNTLWVDLDQELRELESEAGDGFRIDPMVMPEIVFDPRDGTAERLQKAEILERRAAAIDTTIMDVDRQIKSLNDRIRMERQRGDLMATLDRFDDTRLPVVSGQPTGDRDRPTPSDSASVGSEPLSLDDQLSQLREIRERLVQYRDEHLVRARVFRQSVRSVAS
jgi:hypothetical protein